MIFLDNSVLVDGLTGQKRSAPGIERAIELGEPLRVPALVLYEWLRGPRLLSELEALNRLIRPESVIPFGVEEAKLAAELYLTVDRPRSRAFDLGIAASAIVYDAPL